MEALFIKKAQQVINVYKIVAIDIIQMNKMVLNLFVHHKLVKQEVW